MRRPPQRNEDSVAGADTHASKRAHSISWPPTPEARTAGMM
jgi:hypothetical protein